MLGLLARRSTIIHSKTLTVMTMSWKRNKRGNMPDYRHICLFVQRSEGGLAARMRDHIV